MGTDRLNDGASLDPGRQLTAGESTWIVREVNSAHVPGSRGARCLVFSSADVVRRVWRYPPNWRVLDDQVLWGVCDVPPLPQPAIANAVAAVETPAAIGRSAADIVETSRSLLAERARLLAACRETHGALREAVSVLTRELRAAGVGAGPALVMIKDAVRSGMAECATSQAETDDAVRDAGQWCITAYFAA